MATLAMTIGDKTIQTAEIDDVKFQAWCNHVYDAIPHEPAADTPTKNQKNRAVLRFLLGILRERARQQQRATLVNEIESQLDGKFQTSEEGV